MTCKRTGHFASLLRAARIARRLSQADVAQRAGLPPSVISHFEAGRRKPSLDNLTAIVRALGVSADNLLFGPARAAGWQPTEGLHPDTASLVERFAEALAAKLRRAELKYHWTNEWADADWRERCQADLAGHVAKGDPLDVAAYAAFCWAHGWPTSPPPPPAAGTTGFPVGNNSTAQEIAKPNASSNLLPTPPCVEKG